MFLRSYRYARAGGADAQRMDHREVKSTKARRKLEQDRVGLVQLFNGDTMFHMGRMHTAVKKALRSQAARDSAHLLPSFRGLNKFFAGSHLQSLCEPD